MSTGQIKNIGARIRTAREKAGLSRAEASKAWKLNERTLEFWEQGRGNPAGLYLLAIEKILSKIERSK